MSEESDDEEEDNAFTVHTPCWRSKILQDLINKLNIRDRRSREQQARPPMRSRRHKGSLGTKSPGGNVPEWAISEEWLMENTEEVNMLCYFFG